MNAQTRHSRDMIMEELSSPEGQLILGELKKNMHLLENALDPDNIMKFVKTLSDEAFYATAIYRGTVVINEGVVDVVPTPGISTGGGGILSKLMNLLKVLTEGGSLIGILHLLLDVIGLISDPLGIGLVADVLNAVIYFFRAAVTNKENAGHMALLGIISLVAAAVPFAGDMLKAFKPALKVIAPAMSHVGVKGGGKLMAKETAEILAKADPRTIKKVTPALMYLKKTVGSIIAAVTKTMEYLFRNIIGSVVGYIPLLGGMLKRFFVKIADKLKLVTANLVTFGKSVDDIAQVAMVAKVTPVFKHISKSLDNAIINGSKITKEGDFIVITSSKGGTEKILVDDFLKAANVAKRYPDGPMARYLQNDDAVAHFYNYMSKNGFYTKEFLDSFAMKMIGFGVYVKKFAAFIAKNLIRLFGNDWNALSKAEQESLKDMVTTSELHKVVHQHNKNDARRKGALISVPVIDMTTEDFPETVLDESKSASYLQDHLRYLAHQHGGEHITPAKYFWAQAKKNKDEKDLAKLYSYNTMSSKEYEKFLDKEASRDVLESKKMKHVRVFGNF